MSYTVKHWLGTVEGFYGSLDRFDHAPTVRHMRNIALDLILEHRSIAEGIADEEVRKDYLAVFQLDINQAKAQLELLDDWLAKRGLTP